jgi:hypothetical protein
MVQCDRLGLRRLEGTAGSVRVGEIASGGRSAYGLYTTRPRTKNGLVAVLNFTALGTPLNSTELAYC